MYKQATLILDPLLAIALVRLLTHNHVSTK